MPKRVVWSPIAVEDFENIVEYLSIHWEAKVLNRFIDKVENLINQISLNPQLYPEINKELGVRKCVISKHNTLYYSENQEQVNILRIYDNRQNPQTLKFR